MSYAIRCDGLKRMFNDMDRKLEAIKTRGKEQRQMAESMLGVSLAEAELPRCPMEDCRAILNQSERERGMCDRCYGETLERQAEETEAHDDRTRAEKEQE